MQVWQCSNGCSMLCLTMQHGARRKIGRFCSIPAFKGLTQLDPTAIPAARWDRSQTPSGIAVGYPTKLWWDRAGIVVGSHNFSMGSLSAVRALLNNLPEALLTICLHDQVNDS